MCLAIPAQVVELRAGDNAVVDLAGVPKEISLALVDNVLVGEYLILHVALGNGAGRLKQAVGKRAFAVVNMCYYRKISYMCAVGSLHAPPCLS